MAISKPSNIPFSGTQEQEKRLRQVLQQLQNRKGALMPALQQAQEIYGYLPREVMAIVAEALHLSLEEVYGVATFYAQFSLNPKGKYKIGVCLGTACYVKGAGAIFDAMKKKLQIEGGCCTLDGKFSLDATRCIGCCGLAPVLTVNDDVYGKVSEAQVEEILAKYL